jgi:hypothetical protein
MMAGHCQQTTRTILQPAANQEKLVEELRSSLDIIIRVRALGIDN